MVTLGFTELHTSDNRSSNCNLKHIPQATDEIIPSHSLLAVRVELIVLTSSGGPGR
jgi:hypothetical protein